MALSNAERQRRHYYKIKEMERKLPDAADDAYRFPFHEFMKDRWEDLDPLLEWAGIEKIPDYASDKDNDPDWRDEETHGPYRGALGRAERMVGYFLDAAVTLAEHINAYKKDELDARIAEAAGEDIENLTAFREQLEKQVRWNVPRWKTKET